MRWHEIRRIGDRPSGLGETLALAAALLLGRRRIYAGYLTRGRARVFKSLVAAQLLLLVLGIRVPVWLVSHGGAPSFVQHVVLVWCLVTSLVLWLAAARLVLSCLERARRTASLVPLVPDAGCEFDYDPPSRTDYRRHLEGYLRLGTSRTWARSALGSGAAARPPRMAHPAGTTGDSDAAEDEAFASWVWDTQADFEPSLVMKVALASLLTLNPVWFLTLSFSSISLARCTAADRRDFESLGRTRYWELVRKEREAAQRQTQEEAAAAERQRYVVQPITSPHPSAADAYRRLPAELRRLMGEAPTE